jgi:hypothetical protein
MDVLRGAAFAAPQQDMQRFDRSQQSAPLSRKCHWAGKPKNFWNYNVARACGPCSAVKAAIPLPHVFWS